MSAPTAAGGGGWPGTPRAMLAGRVAASPDRVFLRGSGTSMTFGEFEHAKRRAAGALADLGVGPGDRVLIGMSNRPEMVIVQHAVAQLGAVQVPLVPGLSAEELEWLTGHSRARTLVADEPIAGLLRPRLHRCPEVRACVFDVEAALTHEPLDPAPLPDDPLAPWAILYTSGSTGRPKGVVLPAAAFHSGGTGYAERFGVRADDNCLIPTPLGHAVGALTVQAAALHKGSALTIVDRFSPTRFWNQVIEHGVTFVVLFPAQLNLLLETQAEAPTAGATTLRMVWTHAWHARFLERFGGRLTLCWGMTETGAVSAGSEPGYAGDGVEGYIGPGWPLAEIAAFDDAGGRLPSGGIGEIRLRHPHAMLGYLDDPASTATTLVDGWVRSGDRGYIDERGHLVYLGRFKHVIKRSGENIGAEEVESAIDPLPGVIESLVFAVPDPIRTEEVMAVVAAAPGATLDPAALTDAVGERLARWKVPRYVLIMSGSLPRLPNGKLDRVTARERYDPIDAWDRSAASASARSAASRPQASGGRPDLSDSR
jgi:acyl-CoA synthetase (AMP-forming)/AMP-acid ligase II